MNSENKNKRRGKNKKEVIILWKVKLLRSLI
jgi:hypothetical protein